ncbi:MAG TPA: hypothetical protein VK918_09405, partial [Pyrinomonadaceae bacterium]|nr:hypothetical protein [Pyrinomonadaceae bacterium]
FETKIASIASNPSCECWWPVGADKSSFAEREPITVPGREGQVISSDGRIRIFRVGPGAEAAARISLFYYPRWHATVNGTNAGVSPDANGAINVVIPEGESELHLEFIETNQMKAATVLSLFTWLGLTGSLVFGFIRRFKPRDFKDCETE